MRWSCSKESFWNCPYHYGLLSLEVVIIIDVEVYTRILYFLLVVYIPVNQGVWHHWMTSPFIIEKFEPIFECYHYMSYSYISITKYCTNTNVRHCLYNSIVFSTNFQYANIYYSVWIGAVGQIRAVWHAHISLSCNRFIFLFETSIVNFLLIFSICHWQTYPLIFIRK